MEIMPEYPLLWCTNLKSYKDLINMKDALVPSCFYFVISAK